MSGGHGSSLMSTSDTVFVATAYSDAEIAGWLADVLELEPVLEAGLREPVSACPAVRHGRDRAHSRIPPTRPVPAPQRRRGAAGLLTGCENFLGNRVMNGLGGRHYL